MLEIEPIENFKQAEEQANELLAEYDARNGVEYNFKRFGFVAKQNKKPVGYITGFSYYAEVTIDNLVVAEEHRGKGVGTRLIEQVQQYFVGRGFNNINLVTNEFQAPEFYEKCGFELEFKRVNKTNPKLTKYFFVKYF